MKVDFKTNENYRGVLAYKNLSLYKSFTKVSSSTFRPGDRGSHETVLGLTMWMCLRNTLETQN